MPLPRRNFLKSAAAVVPVTALHELIARAAFAQSPDAATAPELHVVPNGRDRFGAPHSLGFSSLAFKVVTSDAGGNLFIIEHRNLMPDSGPPLHLHLFQDEWFYVMEGEVVFQVGDQRPHLGAGDSVLAPRQVAHTFSAVGAPAHMLIAFTPAGKMEQYFIDAEAHPKMAATEEFINRYEMKWLGPSPFWKS